MFWTLALWEMRRWCVGNTRRKNDKTLQKLQTPFYPFSLTPTISYILNPSDLFSCSSLFSPFPPLSSSLPLLCLLPVWRKDPPGEVKVLEFLGEFFFYLPCLPCRWDDDDDGDGVCLLLKAYVYRRSVGLGIGNPGFDYGRRGFGISPCSPDCKSLKTKIA